MMEGNRKAVCVLLQPSSNTSFKSYFSLSGLISGHMLSHDHIGHKYTDATTTTVVKSKQ